VNPRLERHKSKNGEIERRRRGAEASMRGRDRGNEAEDRDVDPRGQEPRDLGQVRQAGPSDGQAQGSRSLQCVVLPFLALELFDYPHLSVLSQFKL
jgi:hypothetical protein